MSQPRTSHDLRYQQYSQGQGLLSNSGPYDITVTENHNGYSSPGWCPVYPDMENANQRLGTFYTYGWPNTNPKWPYNLAHSGFFYSGTGDLCICFYCGEYFSHWKRNESISKRHKSRTYCRYNHMAQL